MVGLCSVSTAALAEPTEILFWTALSGGLGESVQKIIDDFNASQSDYKVVAEFQGNYYDIAAKIQTAVVSGDEPDLVQMECARIALFSDYGIFEDLTDDAEKYGLDASALYPGFMVDCDWGEGLYALPFNRSTPMFYYNKTLFDEKGLTAPKTWDELHEIAKQLSVPGERWGFEVPIDYWFYQCFILEAGGQIMNDEKTDIAFNNESGQVSLALLRDMIDDGSMKAPPGAEYNAFEAARSDLAAGITTMIITSSGDLSRLMASCDFEVGTAYLPAFTQNGVVTGGANVAVLAGHEDKMPGIMAFLKHLTSPEVAGWWAANTGYVPTSEAAAQSEAYQTYLKERPAGATALNQMQFATNQPVLAQWAEIASQIIGVEMSRCVENRDYTPAMCTQTISDAVRALLGTK